MTAPLITQVCDGWDALTADGRVLHFASEPTPDEVAAVPAPDPVSEPEPDTLDYKAAYEAVVVELEAVRAENVELLAAVDAEVTLEGVKRRG